MHSYPSNCEFDMHGRVHPHGTYGHPDEQAVQLVRITCEHCDLFQIKPWCKGCLDGVYSSGRNWRCDGCKKRMPPHIKTQYIVRIGDV